MKRSKLLTIGMLVIFLGFAGQVQAAAGRPNNVYRTNAIVVDGNLGEWANTEWAPLEYAYGNTATLVQAFYSIAWSDTKNRLYVAIKVQDMDHFFSPTFVNGSKGHDLAEIYVHTTGTFISPNGQIDTGYSYYQAAAQQYALFLKPDGTCGAWCSGNDQPWPEPATGLEYAGHQGPDGWYYLEMSCKPYIFNGSMVGDPKPATTQTDLAPGVTVGLDVTVTDTDHDPETGLASYKGAVSENIGLSGKYNNYLNIATHVLTGTDLVIPDPIPTIDPTPTPTITPTPTPTPTMGPAPTPGTIVKAWEFNSTLEGWFANSNISGFAWATDGYVDGTIIAGDPIIKSADNLGLAIGDANKIRIRMKNSNAGTKGNVFFVTNDNTSWGGGKSKSFITIPNDPNYTEYVLNMTGVFGWSPGKTLRQLRLDPSDNTTVTSGTFSVDYIRISNEPTPTPVPVARGNIILEDYDPLDYSVPVSFKLVLFNTDTWEILYTDNKTLSGTGGAFGIWPSVPEGTYSLAIKSYGHCATVVPCTVQFLVTTELGDIILRGGDVHGDNEVFFTPLSIILKYFGTGGDPDPFE